MRPSCTTGTALLRAALLTIAAIPLSVGAPAPENRHSGYTCAESFGPEGAVWYRLREHDRSGRVDDSLYARPADTLPRKRLGVKPSPGPGHQVQLTLRDPPAVPVLVTIQDRLGFTHYQQWHPPHGQLTVRLGDLARTLPPGTYSASVSTGQLFLKEKFIVE